jgi:alkanesulfonate monooxygenase SsuD/methylene tetrahydromethanopterin reductase-like flavin-dependent oxidoreductase (luciferase family)
MEFWYFSEQQYHPAWDKYEGPTCITQPTSHMDPDTVADLFDRYYREFQLADELGLNIAVNEHHSSFACMSVSPLMTLAALARLTKKARLLSLGTQMVNRTDPIRIAEEIALADMLSRGRLEAGLIKGTAVEAFASGEKPVRVTEKFWETVDIVVKALSTTSGAFSWDSENYHYRNVNIVPRCYQQPHPPVWIVGASPSTAQEIARRGYKMSVFGLGTTLIRSCFDAYRAEYRKINRIEAPLDRFGHHALTVVAATESEAKLRGEKLYEFYRTIQRKPPPMSNPPGYASVPDNVKALRSGRANITANFSKGPEYAECIATGKFVVGTPDQVAARIVQIFEEEGGIGNYLLQGGGTLTFEETADHLRLFATEVVPRVKRLLAERVGLTTAA